jgi:hypothetical protein
VKRTDPLPRRPFGLILVAIVFTLLGTLVLLLAVVVGFQIITWDVKGVLLTGSELALFSLALAFVGLLGLGAAVTLWQGHSAGRFLALGFWAGAGLLGLVTDRSVAGPDEPLQTYLVTMMLVPGSITALLLWGLPSVRRFFRHARPPTPG